MTCNCEHCQWERLGPRNTNENRIFCPRCDTTWPDDPDLYDAIDQHIKECRVTINQNQMREPESDVEPFELMKSHTLAYKTKTLQGIMADISKEIIRHPGLGEKRIRDLRRTVDHLMGAIHILAKEVGFRMVEDE